MFAQLVWEEIQAELAQAALSRAAGNEGRARVQARRGAGAACRAYLEQRNLPAPRSALDALTALSHIQGLPEAAYACLERLQMRVDPEYRLPPGMNLLADARRLCDILHQTP